MRMLFQWFKWEVIRAWEKQRLWKRESVGPRNIQTIGWVTDEGRSEGKGFRMTPIAARVVGAILWAGGWREGEIYKGLEGGKPVSTCKKLREEAWRQSHIWVWTLGHKSWLDLGRYGYSANSWWLEVLIYMKGGKRQEERFEHDQHLESEYRKKNPI